MLSFFSKTFFSVLYHVLDFSVQAWQGTRVLRFIFNFSSCRFYPSCSDYLLEAVKSHGLFSGLVLWTKRIVRCHPLCEGGVDEVQN